MSSSGHFQTSVETTPNGFSFRRPFTDLPAGSHGHCQVTVDADTIMVFGGNLGEKPYKLDVAHGGVWVALPPMSGKRFGPACGLTNGRKTVVVAGGRSAPNVPLATVELLDIERLTWTTGEPSQINDSVAAFLIPLFRHLSTSSDLGGLQRGH